ncbi:MAG: YbbR-like domain-containing protein [Gemmatimonadota bacterium]
MAPRSRALTHNWRLKLSALGLSIFLWALVQTEPTNQETFATVPVFLDIADTSWTVARTPSPGAVEVRFGGPAREIIRLAREGTTLRIPISRVGSRDSLITLRREWVQLGERPGLTVESFSPQDVRVAFEEAEVRLLPVAARLTGRVPDHLAFAAEVDVSPQLVRVSGPRSRVQALDSLPLEAFDLGSIARSGTFPMAVDTSGLLGATVSPTTATLGVRVEALVERVLDGIVVTAVPSPGEAEVITEPNQVQLRLVGARSLVTALDPSRLRVWIPPEVLEGMAPGEERTVRVQIDGVPPLVTAVSGVDRVRVRRAIDGPGGG